MSEIEQEQQSTQNLNLPIDWYVSDNIQRRYASNVFVQSGEAEVVEANDEEIKALFLQIEPGYAITNGMLADL